MLSSFRSKIILFWWFFCIFSFSIFVKWKPRINLDQCFYFKATSGDIFGLALFRALISNPHQAVFFQNNIDISKYIILIYYLLGIPRRFWAQNNLLRKPTNTASIFFKTLISLLKKIRNLMKDSELLRQIIHSCLKW